MPKRYRKAKRRLNVWALSVLVLLVALPLALYLMMQATDIRKRASGNERPNIVVIMTDDQRADWLQYMPKVNSLIGSRGVTFTNSFVSTPLCCPSRASFLTGKYAHHTGVWTNFMPLGSVLRFDPSSTLAVWLKDSGYTTSLIGKYLNEYDNISPEIPPGWDNWQVFAEENGKYFNYRLNENGKTKKYGEKASDYSTMVFQKKAINFIQTTPEPFFLFFSPHEPHGPTNQKANNCGSPGNSPSFNESDVSDKPAWVRDLRKLPTNVRAQLRDAERKKICMLRHVDNATQKIIEALEQTGKLQNTVLVFTSDNGFVFGEHRYVKKSCGYEECIAVPLIIATPEMTTGRTDDRLFTNINLTATLAELAGLDVHSLGMDGISLASYLRGDTADLQEYILIEYFNQKTNKFDFGVRSQQFKYIELGTGERELYNLETDPYELTNVINDSSYTDAISVLSQKLVELKGDATTPQVPSNMQIQDDDPDIADL